MPPSRYWVEIHHGGSCVGAGFFIMQRYVLTARECLRGVEADDTVQLHCADGLVVEGRIHGPQPQVDLALIELTKPRDAPVDLPTADVAVLEDYWLNPYRPGGGASFLTGYVDRADVLYPGRDGAPLKALQLRCDHGGGPYAGYAGSPVERVVGDRALIGVFLGQGARPPEVDGATDVLFAATMKAVAEHFDCFDVGHLMKVLTSEDGLDADSADTPSPVPERAPWQDQLDEATARAQWLEERVERGLLQAEPVKIMMLQLAKQVAGSGGASREVR
ncbi:hypothetical protein KDL01_21105 [Actinospica durhamensis]|uniref:Trypsin-like serine protease n=1 Tax=Actinospica durhamensis TaxID=1508375 RepID=A0A941INU0_9ACTN|nr:trypsin-like peptidase domain-containing protein [Actinospica durhamensis]MBR7835785.1 hypothetical protein [Actinospica durhamensis]